MLTHIKNVINWAEKNKCAVGAFNTFNLETTLAIAQAANKMKTPVIIQVTESTLKYAGLKNIFNIIKSVSENEEIKIPITIHLDHGKDLQIIKKCIKLGFSSIHFDGSELSYQKNLTLTRKVVKYAHKRKVWVQGELGRILGSKNVSGELKESDLQKSLTSPGQAREFVKKTGIDTLAPSVGALHGVYKGRENLKQALIKQIAKEINIPLVLHGGSGVSQKDLVQAIKNGIRVVNIDTELRQAFTESLRKVLKKDLKVFDPRKILYPEIEAMQKVVEEKILILKK